MSFLSWLFLESFYALAALCALVLYALLVYWRRSGDGRPLLVGLLAAVVLLIMQQVVVTQREQAADILTHIERDLNDRSVAALRSSLSHDFAAGHFDGPQLIDAVQHRLQSLRVTNIRRSDLDVVASAPDRFDVLAWYVCDIVGHELGNGTVRSHWRFGFARENGEWKFASIQQVWIETTEWRMDEVLR